MNKPIAFTILIGIFLLGWLSNSVYSQIYFENIEVPYALDFNREKSSPGDWIKKDKIHVYEDRIIIDVKDAEWAEFTDTNSMDPFLDVSSNSIELKPEHENNLSIGDIISYRSKYANGLIIHRIIEISEDDQGWYAVVKGDNNPQPDPGKIRFEQIEGVLVGILY